MRIIVFLVMFFAALPAVAKECFHPRDMQEDAIRAQADASVSISEIDYKGHGTGVFTSSRTIVTVAHVTRPYGLLHDRHLPIVLAQRHNGQWRNVTVGARILARYTGAPQEAVVEIELTHEIVNVRRARVRATTHYYDEIVTAYGFTGQGWRAAVGRFVGATRSSVDQGTYAGYEVRGLNGDPRAIDEGASGGLIVDCSGELIALISQGRRRPSDRINILGVPLTGQGIARALNSR